MVAILIKAIHVIVCISLIVIVLFQADKGEGLAGAFGGGASSTVFGERGSGGFMSKLTTTLAIVFMITSLVIAVYGPDWEKQLDMERYNAAPISAPMQSMPGIPVRAPVPVAAPVDIAPKSVDNSAAAVAPSIPAPVAVSEEAEPSGSVTAVVEEKRPEIVESIPVVTEEVKAETVEPAPTAVEEVKTETDN